MSFLAEHAVAGKLTVYANIPARHQQRHQKSWNSAAFLARKPKASRMPSKSWMLQA
jgi:hypothetical protein